MIRLIKDSTEVVFMYLDNYFPGPNEEKQFAECIDWLDLHCGENNYQVRTQDSRIASKGAFQWTAVLPGEQATAFKLKYGI